MSVVASVRLVKAVWRWQRREARRYGATGALTRWPVRVFAEEGLERHRHRTSAGLVVGGSFHYLNGKPLLSEVPLGDDSFLLRPSAIEIGFRCAAAPPP
jgi:hypothetical protein